MAIKHSDELHDPALAGKLADAIGEINTREIRLMEVCGTHTMSIFKSGIRSLLPETISLLSGPGCPVCVTAQGEIDAFIELARREDVIVTTFGDLMRVPGSASSLQKERAGGADIRMVYSSLDAVEIARQNPHKQVVFLGVGFETTIPTIAASILTAYQTGVANYSVYAAHKLAPPALAALMETEGLRIDGFLMPGHVSVIIGCNAYLPLFETYHVPSVIAGFEPLDILDAVRRLVVQVENETPQVENAYPRAVTDTGNVKAQALMASIFETIDVVWRGIGKIPKSGLKIREKYRAHDAASIFDLPVADAPEPKGCACGEILTGLKAPPECPLFRKTCTPVDPVGPCMVSSEGTCAAYYRYSE